MTLTDADRICNFIEDHYDMVDQESWFDLCELLLDVICKDANKNRFALPLKRVHPGLFE